MAEEWGVMFHDDSVRHPWNGHTQRTNAENYWRLWRKDFAPDDIRLARRVDGGKWHQMSYKNWTVEQVEEAVTAVDGECSRTVGTYCNTHESYSPSQTGQCNDFIDKVDICLRVIEKLP